MQLPFSRLLLLVCLLFSFCFCHAQSYPPTSTYYSTETSNNTSACPSSGSAAWCTSNFAGLYDHYKFDGQYPNPNQAASASQAEGTPGPSGYTVVVPAPQNISLVPFQTLLYPGQSSAGTQIVCHYQPWFQPGDGHIDIGMDETQATTVHEQANNMIARGCNIVVLDWYGGVDQNGNTPLEETVAEQWVSDLDQRCNGTCPLLIAIMEDHGTATTSTNSCKSATYPYECAYENDVSFLFQHEMTAAAYWKLNTSGCSNRPVLISFGYSNNTDTSGPPPVPYFQFSDIKSYIHSNLAACNNEPLLVAEGDAPMSDANEDGSYNWVGVDPYWSPQYLLGSSTADQSAPAYGAGSGGVYRLGDDGTGQFNPHFWPYSDWTNDPNDPNGYSNYVYGGNAFSVVDWYYNARNVGIPNGKSVLIGSAYAGFNDTNTELGWGYTGGCQNNPGSCHPNGRVIARQCGRVWLQAWSHLTSEGYFSSSSPIQAVGIPTWNDYEEGSAIEPGIDNCMNVSDQTVNGNNYSFHINLTDSTYGTENTVYEYVIWYSTDGTGSGDHHLQQWTTVTPNGSGSYTVSLQGLPVTPALIYAEAIGKPSIFNHITSGQVYNPQVCSLTVTPTSLNFGDQTENTTSSAQQISITANGAACTISSISTTANFAQTNNCPSSLAAGNSCQANITFSPPGIGNYSGTLTVDSSNSSNGNPQVSLSGTGVSGGYTYANVDDLSGWNACGDPGCAGGNGTATYSLTQNVGSPSLDGGSTQFALTGGPAYSDIKYWNQQSLVSGSSFTNDLYAYITNTNAVQGLGFGVTQDVGGLKYTFRYMCDFRGTTHWLLWDSANGDWYDTGIACSTSDFPSNNWIHLTFYFEHTSGNQMLYQSFTINGVNHSVNVTLNPEVENDSPFIQFQILQWGDYEQDTYSVYVDDWNVSVQ